MAANLLPLVLLAGGAVVLMSKKKKKRQEVSGRSDAGHDTPRGVGCTRQTVLGG